MQQMIVLQSIWAMERRHTDGKEYSLEQSIEKIHGAGFDGISSPWFDRDLARRSTELMRGTGMVVEGVCFPKTIDDLKPILDICTEFKVDHINLQPDVRTRSLDKAIQLVEGWIELSSQVDFPIYIETHRDRLTTDMFFTLDLLDRIPEMKLLADLSHYLVGREFWYPISPVDTADVHRILDRSWAFHGRVASREQVQVEISFPHHDIWVDLFKEWWAYGFASWRKRNAPSATLSFTCELGPKPYAITGRDGNDTTDRWEEALKLKDIAREIWISAQQTPAPLLLADSV